MGFDHRRFVDSLTRQPGVYRMLDASGEIIYVGKARDLKRRVRSYFSPAAGRSPKLRVLRERTAAMEVTVTHTENEALILENNLIKAHRPRYNVWFRDDKSYPCIRVSSSHDFPRFSYWRGTRRKGDQYLGPFPGASAALQTLHLLQKLFQLRSCVDSVFAHRSRPCLQYQIGRCSAPCVGYISREDYRQGVDHALLFLAGRSEELVQALTAPMQAAAAAQDFERAAHYRDQLRSLRRVQEKQYIDCAEGDVDIVVCLVAQGQACVEWASVRGGRHLGSRAFYPHHDPLDTPGAILSAFLSRMCSQRPAGQAPGREILCNEAIEERALLESLLSNQAGHRVVIRHRLRARRAKWLEMTRENAELSLHRRLSRRNSQRSRFADLQQRLALPVSVQRIECFDVSHTRGEATVAACVVFTPDGARPREYRRFNIRAATGGDDYRALGEALRRRYGASQAALLRPPDLLLVDGGRGQVRVARQCLQERGLEAIPVLGVAKGPERRAGTETLVTADGVLILPEQSPAQHLIQQIRDEAHRFAVQAHRRRRAHSRTRSQLQEIEGIGPQRARVLLQYFAGIQGVWRAGIDDLAQAPGIHRSLAKRIHSHFHGE